MSVSAILKGAGPRRLAQARPPGRIVILAWSLAIVALGAAFVSSLFGPDYGARALVVAAPAEAPVAPQPVQPAPVLVDPARFRREAPPQDGRPRVAVIVRGLGLSNAATREAIAGLPADVTLALSAYGRQLQRDADEARADGHEVFLDMPVEPLGYPANDAGPHALLISLPEAENAARLRWALGRFTGFPGLVFAPGSPALDSGATMAPLISDPSLQGLVWAHAGAKGLGGAPAEIAAAIVSIDAATTPREIDAAFERLEAAARQTGAALAIVSPTPVALDRLKAWTGSLDAKGIVLAPASALAVAPAS